MNVTWRPGPPPQEQRPLCGCRHCTRAGWIMMVTLAAAFLSMAPLLLTPSLGCCAVTGSLLAVFMTALYWPCPSRRRARRLRRCRGHRDLEALIKATREPAAAAIRERAGQRFTGMHGHFAEWEAELRDGER